MKLNLRALGRLALGTAVLLAGPAWAQDDRPNIVLIVADDLGYSDLGSFGSEIATPNLDALAADGVQLTNFHVGPTCSPTRSMLMSGTDNHVAGLGSMAEEILEEQRGHPGYEGYLNERVMSFPQALRDAGYHTYMTGKWHLGGKEGQRPNARGFEKSFANLGAGAHFFDQTGLLEMFAKANYTQDDVPVDLPADFGYATDIFTDRMLDYIASGDDAPFFAYLAYTTPHWPLQAPDADIALFKGKYDEGYEATRAARLARMADMDLIPAGTTQNLAPDLWPHWEELSEEQRAIEARKMEVYAAMVHNLDQNVGRLVASLKEDGEYENTVFVFFSDNGAEGSLPDSIQGGKNRIWIEENFDNSLENMGRQGSYFGYGPSWASVSQTPFRMVKGHVYEGGIRAPAFITMPGSQGREGRSDAFAHVSDIAPTLLDIAGAEEPREFGGIALAGATGYSLLPWLQGNGEIPRPQDQPVCTELFGRLSVWKDSWKLVHENSPWGTGNYELFNLKNDLPEANDPAAAEPAKLAELQQDWADCQSRFGIYWNAGLAPQMVYGNDAEYLFPRPHVRN